MSEQVDTSMERRQAARLCSLLDVYKDFQDLVIKYDQICGEGALLGEPDDEVYEDALKACTGYSEMLGKRILAQSDYLLQRCATRYFELDQLTENEEEQDERTKRSG